MNICFFNLTAGFKRGGLETYCWEVGHALAQRGHRVTVVGGEGGAARHDDVELVGFPYKDRESFPNFGTRFRKLMERMSLSREAYPYLLGRNFDAVVVNKPFDFPALWRLRRAGWSGVSVFRSGGGDFFLGDRYFAKAIDLWLSTSRYNAGEVEAHFRRPLQVVPNGVDAQRFRPSADRAGLRARLALPPESFLIASCGRLIGLKGLSVVIQALPALPAAHFVIIGDGPERSRLEALARELGVGERVRFAGGQPHHALPEWLAAADLFVQPTIGEEAFGISVVEAMACGLPVLVSDRGGLPEVVEDGQVGRILAPGDVAVWTDAIAAALADASLRRRWGAAARERAVGRFSWAANAERLEGLIMKAGRAR